MSKQSLKQRQWTSVGKTCMYFKNGVITNIINVKQKVTIQLGDDLAKMKAQILNFDLI